MRSYIQALIDGRWDDARTHWAPEAIASSERLGIRYIGTEAKYDCNSPIYIFLDSIRVGRSKYSTRDKGRRFGWKEIEVKTTVRLGPFKSDLKTTYYLEERGDRWLIQSPLEFISRGWPTWTSRYVHVYCRDSARVNPYGLDLLDHFTDSILTMLGVSPDRRAVLEREKIDYYIVDYDEIGDITSSPAKGVALQSYNAVVTDFLTHTHELAHILLEFAAEELPRFPPSFVREGAATALGGGGHMSPAVALQYGDAVTQGGGYFDDLMPSEDLRGRVKAGRLSYSKGSVLSACLIRTLGGPGFIDFYRRMSKVDGEPEILDRVAVMDSLESILGTSYDPYVQECKYEFDERRSSGIRPAVGLPDREPDAISQDTLCNIRIWQEEDRFVFSVKAPSRLVLDGLFSGRLFQGRLLLKCEGGTDIDGYHSLLFNRYPSESQGLSGVCCGIFIAPSVVRLENYKLDRLEAIVVPSYDSKTAPIYDRDRGTIEFEIESRLLPPTVLQSVDNFILIERTR